MYKTAISNICWGDAEDSVFLKKLAEYGACGIEVAPSVLWKEPVSASLKQRRDYRQHVEHFGLKIVSLHALFYTRPDLCIFGSAGIRKSTKEYLVRLGALAADLGTMLMIMGSPKNRRRGNLSKKEAMKRAADFFYSVAKGLEIYKTTLCIEPLAIDEADFIVDHTEALELVNYVGHPNFEMMLDVKSMFKSNTDYLKAFQESSKHIRHIHVNDPGNTVPGSNGVNHSLIAEALRTIQYDGILSLEVGRSVSTPMANLEKGFNVLNNIYCRSKL